MRIQISVTNIPLILYFLCIKEERETYGVHRLGSKKRTVTKSKGTLLKVRMPEALEMASKGVSQIRNSVCSCNAPVRSPSPLLKQVRLGKYIYWSLLVREISHGHSLICCMQYPFRQPYFCPIYLLHAKELEVQLAKCHSKQNSSHARPSVLSTANRQGDRGIASIVILKNLDLADEHVQIQVLEVRAWPFSFFLQTGFDTIRL